MKLFRPQYWPPWMKTGVIQRLDLQPGDKIVITFRRRLSAQDAEYVVAKVRTCWHIDTAVNPVGILDDDATIKVIRPPDLVEQFADPELTGYDGARP